MPGKSNVSLGNLALDTMVYVAAVTYPTIAANGQGSNTLTIPGLQALDLISWNMQNPPAHLALDNIYVSAPNTATILWSTDSAGVSTGTVAVLFEICRVAESNLGTQAIPSALV